MDGLRQCEGATRVGVVKEAAGTAAMTAAAGRVAKARVMVLGDEGGLDGVDVGARATRGWAW